ncbi:LOW QUALITY PROTEIN: homeobox-leucine zipper protein ANTHOCYANINLESS 2-like [Prosopis cineraria]|uniref:LOW QUALITY PROTEIN: homeobox-leucine zipper protein ANTHOCYANINLESS 2-like n=1 Tax=Prosopis cineraria TaxID=364024 RepID=UPI002410510F|nr:LOW QUALITY PROTEIN: homeobox-leucine zipper protein ANTHOCYANINLESS 2-like [Prosopis cineraria]
MSFGGFLDNNGWRCGGGGGGGGDRIVADIPYSNGSTNDNRMPSSGSISQPCVVTQPAAMAKSMFSSPGLSLALQTNLDEQQGDANRMPESYEPNVGARRSREEEHESRSGSDNMEGPTSGDDQDAADNPPRKKRYHRHTPQQIQELEALFKECPHPDEKQRLELSRRLSLETRQVKFWFQNRRTQMKTQLERHENTLLRQENDKLRAENMSIREAMRNPICSNCGGPAIIGEISLEEQHLRIENARLKDELDRVCALAGKFLGRPISSLTSPIGPPLPNSSLELGVGMNGFGGMSTVPSTLPLGPDFGISSQLAIVPPATTSTATTMTRAVGNLVSGLDRSIERSMFLELALAAMDELVKMVHTDEPLWLRSSEEGGREILNHEEYMRTFSSPCIGMRPNGFVSEASRETGMVIINSLALVETLMDSNRWAEMFPCLIARTSTTEVISSGINGTRNGALQLMHAELQVLSPLVPVREVNFLRFCKQHAEGVWAVVDVSIETIREPSGAAVSFMNCRRLPSGCVVQDMPNGYSKVTWVEHAEYDESQVHQLYRSLLSSGMGFGAQRWVATLQRQCECLAILMSSSVPSRDHTAAITAGGRRSMLKLAQRMTNNFCAGVCASTVHKWNKLNAGNVDEDVRVMTRKSVDDPGEPPGIVLSAATSVWLPVSPQRLFDFLRDERLRSEWDILSNGGPMQEMAHIAKGQDHGNCVSLLRASAMNANQSSMLILQETCIDAAGSLVVYAPVDIPAMHVVMNGGDSAYVALLPSGFAIVPDGPGSRGSQTPASNGDANGGVNERVSGSLLTVAFQILVNSLPTAKLTVESVETVNNLISCTVQKIKAALHCES